MVDMVALLDPVIPVLDQNLVMLFDRFEWPIAVLDNVRVPEVGIRGKK